MFTPEDASSLSEKTPVTPGNIVQEGLSSRLNVIFDVDHTLIYAFDRCFANVIPGTTKDTHRLQLHDARGTEMTLVTREGIQEMFEYLEPFCTFFVYSHGLKSYIEKILDVIDPHQRFFKERHERVLAPKDPKEQQKMREHAKNFRDFHRNGNSQNACLFTDAELDRCIIIDDQYLAIHPDNRGKYAEHLPHNLTLLSFTDLGCMLHSKKYVKLFDMLQSKQKQTEYQSF